MAGLETILLRGGAGHDILFGRDGDDELYGGAGRDVLVGGTGADLIYGRDTAPVGADPDLIYRRLDRSRWDRRGVAVDRE